MTAATTRAAECGHDISPSRAPEAMPAGRLAGQEGLAPGPGHEPRSRPIDWSRDRVSASLAVVADAFARSGAQPTDLVELLRVAAGMVLEPAAGVSARNDAPGHCRGCGGPLPAQHTGRPRRWCGDGPNRGHCRKRAANARMGAGGV
jgi:hypothetical protein